MMNSDEVTNVVRTTLALLQRIAKKTRTPADDLMAGVLKVNESKLVSAVLHLARQGQTPATEAQIADALRHVGINVD